MVVVEPGLEEGGFLSAGADSSRFFVVKWEQASHPKVSLPLIGSESSVTAADQRVRS